MKKLTLERANELKAQGITHIASICKRHFNTGYFKLASIDRILENGGKMPHYEKWNGFVHGELESHIDWSKTIRWSTI